MFHRFQLLSPALQLGFLAVCSRILSPEAALLAGLQATRAAVGQTDILPPMMTIPAVALAAMAGWVGPGGYGWNSMASTNTTDGGFSGAAFPASTSALVMGGGGGAGTTNNGTSCTYNP